LPETPAARLHAQQYWRVETVPTLYHIVMLVEGESGGMVDDSAFSRCGSRPAAIAPLLIGFVY
jgi:hypothetical protein